MGSFTRKCLELLVVLACLGTTSCEQRKAENPSETSNEPVSEGQENVEQKPLSREEIIEAANSAAREHGYDINKYRVIFDEHNTIWRSNLSGIYVPQVEGHDFQVVIYRLREAAYAGDIVVVIDKNTGKLLRIFKSG